MSSGITIPGNNNEAFVPAARIQHSFVGALEKRTLLWLAARTPACIHSDHLTLLGFVSQCLVGICYAFSRLNPDMLIVGVVCLFLNWLGDSLDGTLARFRNRQRPRYGFYVDHITDTFAAFFLMGGLSVSGYVHPAIGLGMLIAFLMLSVEAYLATYTLGKFQLAYCRFGPTEIRILLAVGNIALLRHPTVSILNRRVLLFDFGGLVAIAGMSCMLVVSAIRHTTQLYREERIA
jgi:archaetidylinositol phosphate synthase